MLQMRCFASQPLLFRARPGFMALAAVALLTPFSQDMPAATANDSDPDTPSGYTTVPSPPPRDEQALEEFLQTYRLAPGQNLKRVPKPRPSGMRLWLNRDRPGQGDRLDEISSMVFRWNDPDHLQPWSSRYGGGAGWPVRDLPRYLEMDVFPVEIEGDPELLKMQTSGDWIYRMGIPADQMVGPLEKLMQLSIKRRLTLEFRQVERDIVVARGRYRYAPLAGRSKNEIEIYGKQLVGDGGGGGGGSGTFPHFLKWVGEWIERPVVSEVEAPPPRGLSWSYNGRSPSTEQTRREDHDEALVLKHLEEQTGLTFTRERRPIRVLFIERAN